MAGNLGGIHCHLAFMEWSVGHSASVFPSARASKEAKDCLDLPSRKRLGCGFSGSIPVGYFKSTKRVLAGGRTDSTKTASKLFSRTRV